MRSGGWNGQDPAQREANLCHPPGCCRKLVQELSHLDERVQLLISANGQLQVARRDTLHLWSAQEQQNGQRLGAQGMHSELLLPYPQLHAGRAAC